MILNQSNMKTKILLFLFLGMLNAQAQTSKKTTTTKKATTTKAIAKKPATNEGIFANIVTNKGTIVVALEYKKAPVTVANFISLAEGKNTFVTDEKLKGKPFFDGLKFHRVIADFMIQGGDPTGTGTSGPGYAFKDESNDLKFDKGGILAMANSGPATNGSQFFITHKETPWLTGKHTIFGHVTQGMDIVNLIAQNDVILKITIDKKGTAAKAFNAPKVFSDYFSNKEEDAKKQAVIDAENMKKQAAAELEKRKIYLEKYAPIIAAKKAYLTENKNTATALPSGVSYKILEKGSDKKPISGATVYISYEGYLEDGTLFDSNYVDVAKAYGIYDNNRDLQGGYGPMAFQTGQQNMIPGFIEGLNLLSFNDKAILFIPAALGYGANGAGNIIPPDANLIFEIKMIESKPEKK